MIVMLVVAIMIVLPRIHRSLPASLIAVGVATFAAHVLGLSVATIGAIPSSLPLPSLPIIQVDELPSLLSSALAIAALAGIESLLSAKVADGLADGANHDPDRELFGQGLANIAAAMFGGMPATGAIARTAVNVRSGGRTRLAAIAHGVVLFLVVLLLAPVVAEVPLAALAGVLMVTAIRMIEFGSWADCCARRVETRSS